MDVVHIPRCDLVAANECLLRNGVEDDGNGLKPLDLVGGDDDFDVGELRLEEAQGLRAEGVISVSFGCPYEGHVPAERVFAIAERLAAAGCEEVAFGDTTGMANPAQVRAFFDAARERLPGVELTAHFHNTRGQGLANVLAALESGVRSFESSFGELGGCPVPRGATGNIASEDLVSMLHEMGYSSGIDLEALVECAREVQRVLGRALSGHVVVAGPVDWHEGG